MSGDNLSRLMARHGENKSKFHKGGNGYKWLDLRKDLPDGETRLRVIPSESGNLYDTFVFRGKHQGIIPPTEKDLKARPDAKHKAATCNLLFDKYCHICDLVDRLGAEEDEDLRYAAEDMAAIPVVYFNTYIVGKENEGVYVATTTRETLINQIRGWIESVKPGGEYENQEFAHPKTGKAIIVKHTWEERRDGKIMIKLELSVGQKTIPVSPEMLGKRNDLTKILKQLDDDTVMGYLNDLGYTEFVS